MSEKIDVKSLADYAVNEGTQNTEDGSWETSYEELYNHFGVEISPNDEACKELAEAIRQRREVRGLTITEDGIDVSYDTLFCKNLTLEGVSPMLERHPSILAYAVEMSRLADRYARGGGPAPISPGATSCSTVRKSTTAGGRRRLPPR